MNKDSVNTYISYIAILGVIVKMLQIIFLVINNPRIYHLWYGVSNVNDISFLRSFSRIKEKI